MCCKCGTERARSPKRKAYNKRRRAHDAKWRQEYNKRNAEKVKEVARRNAWKNRKKFLAEKRKYYKKNRKRLLETSARSREKHRERLRERNRKRYQENPEYFRSAIHNIRAKRAKAKGKHTPEQIKLIYQRQNGQCVYCKINLHGKYHKDHRKPLSRGGSNWARNIQITCKSCNHRKSFKTHKEFINSTYYKNLTQPTEGN